MYSNALVGVAARYGLRPVLDYGDPALADLFEAVRLLVVVCMNQGLLPCVGLVPAPRAVARVPPRPGPKALVAGVAQAGAGRVGRQACILRQEPG